MTSRLGDKQAQVQGFTGRPRPEHITSIMQCLHLQRAIRLCQILNLRWSSIKAIRDLSTRRAKLADVLFALGLSLNNFQPGSVGSIVYRGGKRSLCVCIQIYGCVPVYFFCMYLFTSRFSTLHCQAYRLFCRLSFSRLFHVSIVSITELESDRTQQKNQLGVRNEYDHINLVPNYVLKYNYVSHI